MLPQHENLRSWLKALEQGGSAGKAAMAALFSAYARPLFGLLRAWGADVDTAEDLCQDFFMKLLSHHRSADDIRDPVCYLYTTARNSFIDWQRRARHQKVETAGVGQEGDDEDTLHATLHAQSGTEGNTDLEKLMLDDAYDLALRHLRNRHPQNFEALWLEATTDSSHEDMAKMLGIKIGAFNQRLSAGKQQLRKILAELRMDS